MLTIEQIYKRFIEMGVKHGPRGKAEIEDGLKKEKEKFKKMSAEDKKFYDEDKLFNPFGDTRVNFGDLKTKVKRVLVGIDIGTEEVLLANELGKMGKKVDLIIAHHPEGRALVDLDKVMDLGHDISVDSGIPINIAEKVYADAIGMVGRSVNSSNAYKAVDAARLLGIPLMSAHTVADNMCYWYYKKMIEGAKVKKVGEIVEVLHKMPEFKEGRKLGYDAMVVAGSADSSVGKISYFGLTGGTNGSADIYEHLSRAGVGTLIDMHIPEDHRKNALKYHLNVVQATHMVSDSVGMNFLMDELEKKGVEVLACGGFIRVSR